MLGYKGKVINIEEIKNDISPDLILTGNILRKDSQLKIYLELLDIKNRKVVWADSFKENIDNIFSLQDKMAMKIVSNLSTINIFYFLYDLWCIVFIKIFFNPIFSV